MCETERGRSLLQHIKFQSEQKIVLQSLKQVQEMKTIVSESLLNVELPIDFHIDLKAAGIIGFFYTEEELVLFLDFLRSAKKITQFFKEKGEQFPEMSSVFSQSALEYYLIERLEMVLDKQGNIKSNASKKLEKLTAHIQSTEQRIIKQSAELFTKNKDKGYLAETELSIKNGRVVLPVLSEHKRKLDGLMIDQSASGKISYIEPLVLVHLNNDLAELHIQRKQEIIEILRSVTKDILPHLSDINVTLRLLALFDFTRSKARLCVEHGWNMPQLSKNKAVLHNATHPLLALHLKQEGKKPVPLNIEFTETQRLIVISGPNAGGKSVALKTVGLLQYMLQSGFLVPLDVDSSMKLYQNIFVDIGDDQSIESDLSTYSSHLTAAKHIVNFSDEDTLVLMDEIGTGTDPMFGGPMAEAILEFIHSTGAYGVITTHFSNIKTKAKQLKQAANAAMLFDSTDLVPLYHLSIGQAGSSFAYEVARTIGLNKKIINRARKLTNTKQYDLDLLLAEVQEQKEALKQKLQELKTLQHDAAMYEAEYRKLKDDLEQHKSQIIAQAKKQAALIIESSNKEIEQTIRLIKESKADKQATVKQRKKLEATKVGFIEQTGEAKPTSFKVGDRVQIIDTESIGEIVEIKKDKAELIIGSIKTKTKLDRLQKIGAGQKQNVRKYISNSSFEERQKDFSSELDVRGLRTEEALKTIDSWLDSAIILGFTQLRLIHGKGHGILKNQIRSHLKGNSAIAKISYEAVNLGGDGVSLILLN